MSFLAEILKSKFAGKLTALVERLDEVTIEVAAADALGVMLQLRDDPDLSFEQLIDLSGVDYQEYAGHQGLRFAAVYHLLSIAKNCRLRVRVYAPQDDFPLVDSVVDIWPCANWFEREAFDLYGIVFKGHPDLRRLLTDYGFIGHPFRKDFPISGYVEMRYDPDQQRVVYQPVSIEPRENIPRIVREEHYGR